MEMTLVVGIRTDNAMVKPCHNQSGQISHLQCNPRITVDTFHYDVNLYFGWLQNRVLYRNVET